MGRVDKGVGSLLSAPHRVTFVRERDSKFGYIRRSRYICSVKATLTSNTPRQRGRSGCRPGKAYATPNMTPFPACRWELLKKKMNMKNEILPSGLAPKLKDVLQKVKEVLARCACFMVEMVIAVACRLHERGLWPSGQPCSHSHVQPTKQAVKSNIPTAVKSIGTHPHRHALHEALRQNRTAMTICAMTWAIIGYPHETLQCFFLRYLL